MHLYFNFVTLVGVLARVAVGSTSAHLSGQGSAREEEEVEGETSAHHIVELLKQYSTDAGVLGSAPKNIGRQAARETKHAAGGMARLLEDPPDPMSLSMQLMEKSQEWDRHDLILLVDSSFSMMKEEPGSAESRMSKAAKTSKACKQGFVDCDNGFLRINSATTTTTCKDACDGNCCVGVDGSDACQGFTGKICKDQSCSGYYACFEGNIPSVVNSCKGDVSCYKTGFEGYAGPFENACNGLSSCFRAGSYFGGRVGSIQDSCAGSLACAYTGSNSGSVGDIKGGSCIGNAACRAAGSYSGSVGDIKIGSCIGNAACRAAGTGYGGGKGGIGSIFQSCNGINTCEEAGASPYYIDGFSYGGTGPITSNLKTCCNTNFACRYINEDTIPDECTS